MRSRAQKGQLRLTDSKVVRFTSDIRETIGRPIAHHMYG
jgi:hypothetical protein